MRVVVAKDPELEADLQGRLVETAQHCGWLIEDGLPLCLAYDNMAPCHEVYTNESRGSAATRRSAQHWKSVSGARSRRPTDAGCG